MIRDMIRMFDLSPCRTNSRASRYLMYSLPVKQYCFDGYHTNVTLQCMLEEIVADLNQMSSSGLKIDGEACTFRGSASNTLDPNPSNPKLV